MSTTNDAASQPVMNPEEFQSDLTGHVFGIVDDPKTNQPGDVVALLAADSSPPTCSPARPSSYISQTRTSAADAFCSSLGTDQSGANLNTC